MPKETYTIGYLKNRIFTYYRVIGDQVLLKKSGGRIRKFVLCECKCGVRKEVLVESLYASQTKSCGCLQKETVTKRNYKHGLRHHKIYHRWLGIKDRCNNPKNQDYKDYGGRGIKVCPEWSDDYKSFHDWAIKAGFSSELYIDRIDVNGDYSPENCRWVTSEVSGNNKRDNVRLEYHRGEFLTYAEAGKKYSLNPKLIRQRVIVNGFTPIDAVSYRNFRNKTMVIKTSEVYN